MKHKTWFRLVIKAIGVLLVGLNVADVLFVVFFLFELFLAALPVPKPPVLGWPARNLLQFVPALLQFGFGLYLFFGGKWVVNKAIPSNRPYCPECGYDLSQCTSANCPECGVALPAHANIENE